MNRHRLYYLAAAAAFALAAHSASAALQDQAAPKIKVVKPTDPNAPPVAVVEPPDPNAPKVMVVPPPAPGVPPAMAVVPPDPNAPALVVVPPTPDAPPALALVPPDPDAPAVAVVPPPGARVDIAVAAVGPASSTYPACSATITDRCIQTYEGRRRTRRR